MSERIQHALNEGNQVRESIVAVLSRTSSKRIHPVDLIPKRESEIGRLEDDYDRAFRQFVNYESLVASLTSTAPGDINAALYCQAEAGLLRGQLEVIRMYFQDTSARLSAMLTRIDFYRALIISVTALLVSLTPWMVRTLSWMFAWLGKIGGDPN